MVRESYVYEGMGVCVSLGDGGNVGSQGRTGGGDGVG